MTTMYSPKNVDQTYFLIIYPSKVYMLTETGLEKEQPMYMGKDRLKLESILREINLKADRIKTTNTSLIVYTVKENELKLDPQSSFYNILPRYRNL